MLIEFFGMPGAGKTSIAQRIAKDFDFEIIRIERRRELIWRNTLFALAHPVRAVRLFWYVLVNSDSKSFWYKFTNLYLHPNAKYQKAASRKRALIDQGYYQSAISIFESRQERSILRGYMRSVAQPDFLYIFTVSSEIWAERLHTREYVVRTNDGESAFQERLEVMNVNLQLFLNNPELIGTQHAVIDGGESKDKVYEAVATSISSLVS